MTYVNGKWFVNMKEKNVNIMKKGRRESDEEDGRNQLTACTMEMGLQSSDLLFLCIDCSNQ